MPDESVASIIASHADGIFFPNTSELLKILSVLPTGSSEAVGKVIRLCVQIPHLVEVDNDHGQTL